ncbi:MAG TPA: sulfatase-like hydrolase/transferase [Thermoanaerobaculia bacterium]|nr:sulfatase-like hydrolase/transferase [Thermoanaerobaculia bacterium]
MKVTTLVRRCSKPFMTACALLALLAAGCRKGPPGGGPLPSKRGPVLIISVDTLRADHLPIYGYGDVKTPNIDALARDGLTFEEAWAHVPLTLPSHVALLTGELPAENGVRNNLGYRFDAAAHATIPSLLKTEGYATGAAVSTYVLRGSTGLAAAFDSYDDVMDGSGGASVADLQRAGPRTLEVSQKWIGANSDRPFFFMLHLFEPHVPYDPPEPFRSEYAGREYDGEIAAADAVIGEFVRFLKEKNLYDDATIIFLSDHGEGLGDHGESQHGIFLYRESIRVPLVLKLPGSEKAGTRVSTPVGLIDVFPTVAEIAGVDPPKTLAGRSLLAIAQGEKPDRRIFSETMYPRIHLGLSDLVSLADATHHFIDAPRAELYDLKSDPREKKNIIADQRDVHAAMKRESLKHDRTLKAPSSVGREEAARLAALGYLTGSAPAAGDELGDPKDHIADLEAAEKAASLADSGKAEEAIRILRGVVARNPRFADAWSQLGRACERAGRLEDSIAAFRKAIEISPMLAPEGAISLAESYLSLGRVDDSIAHAKLGMATYPGPAHAVLAKANLLKGDFTAAEDEARWLMSDPTRRIEGLVVMAQIRTSQKRIDEAWSLAESARTEAAARGGQPVPLLAFVRGDLLAIRGQVAEAEQAFREEMRLFPRDREAFVRLAALQTLQGQVADAERTFELMLKASPDRSSYLLAADAFKALGQPGVAARWRARARPVS